MNSQTNSQLQLSIMTPLPPSHSSSINTTRASTPNTMRGLAPYGNVNGPQPSPWQIYIANRSSAAAATPTQNTPITPVQPVAQTLQFQHANLRKYSLAPTRPTKRRTTHSSLGEEKEWTMSGSHTARSSAPLTARSSRSPPRTASTARAPLASIDPSWSGVTLPDCLEPRALLRRSVAVAEDELDWVHSGVFSASEPRKQPLMTRLQPGHTKPRPKTLEMLDQGIPLTEMKEDHQEQHLQIQQPYQALLMDSRPATGTMVPSFPVVTSSTIPPVHSERLVVWPSPPPSASVVRSAAERPASALLEGVFDSDDHMADSAAQQFATTVGNLPLPTVANSALLASLDRAYDMSWRNVDEELIQREQAEIQRRYDLEKEQRRIKRKRNKVATNLRSQSPEEAESRPKSAAQQVQDEPSNGASVANSEAPEATGSKSTVKPSQNPRRRTSPAPKVTIKPSENPRRRSSPTTPRNLASAPLHSQFATYDPSIDIGIDIAALPLAFQLPASNQATAASKVQQRSRPLTGAKDQPAIVTIASTTQPPSKLDQLEASIAAQIAELTGEPLSPRLQVATESNGGAETIGAIPVDPLSDAEADVSTDPALTREAQHAILGSSEDLSTFDSAGVDVEEAAAEEAFDLAKQSAQDVVDRFERWNTKRKRREQEKSDVRRLAMSLKPPVLVEVETEVDSFAVDNSIVQPSPKKSGGHSDASTPRPPVSPRKHATATPVEEEHKYPSPLKQLKKPDSAERFFVGKQSDVSGKEENDVSSTTVNDDSSSLPVPLARRPSSSSSHPSTAPPGAPIVAAVHRETIKTVSLRTSGWGSNQARQDREAKKRRLAGRLAGAAPGLDPSSSLVKPGVARNLSYVEGATADEDSSEDEEERERLRLANINAPTRPPPSGTPYARAASELSQRSWGNRIKRSGMGEVAGRGSDARALPPKEERYVSTAERQAMELEAQRAADREQAAEEKEHTIAINRPKGFLGSPSPPDAASHKRESDDDLGRTMLPDPTKAGRGENSGEGLSYASVGSQAIKPIDTPHYMRQIDRSVMRAVKKAPVSNDTMDELLALHKVKNMPKDSPSSSIFPRWLWARKDFQDAYSNVPFETCLRVLNLFPDERTELHLKKLREWILAKALQQNHAHAEKAAGGASDEVNLPSPHASHTPRLVPSSRAASRQVSRSPSRAALSSPNHSGASSLLSSPRASVGSLQTQHTTQTVQLPPSSQDYLSSLPRPILDGLLRVMKTVTYQAGEVVWKQGREGDLFGILVQGKLQARRIEPINSANPPIVTQANQKPATPAAAPSMLSSRRGSMHMGVSTGHRAPPSSSLTPAASPRTGGTTSGSATGATRPGFGRANSLQQRGGDQSARGVGGFGGSSQVQIAPVTPTHVEYLQTILPGAAFGNEKLVGDIEASNHAQVQRKRTLRLWHLLRLSVRRALRDDDQLYTQLSRLTYGSTAGDPSGNMTAAKRSIATSVKNVQGGVGHREGGGGSGGGLSEMKVRKETLIALTDVTVFTISHYAFASIEFEYQQLKLGEGIRFLSSIPFFKTLVFSRLRHLYSLLLPKTLTKGDPVWKQGSSAEEIVFIESGSLALYREVIVTESHRHPLNHVQWSCDETTFSLSTPKPFAVVESRDYVGEDLLDSTVRDFTIRCRSDTAKIWFLRKRYVHLLTKYRYTLEDVSRVRRGAAAAAVSEMLAERYPTHHATAPFTNVDWIAARASAVAKHEDPLLAPEVHYGSTPRDESSEFLYLDAGALYVRLDPSGALLRSVTDEHAHVTPHHVLGTHRATTSKSSRPNTTATGRRDLTDSKAAVRPRKVSRVYTAPSVKDMADGKIVYLEDCFSLPKDEEHKHSPRKRSGVHRHAHGEGTSPKLTSFSDVVEVAVTSPVINLRRLSIGTMETVQAANEE